METLYKTLFESYKNGTYHQKLLELPGLPGPYENTPDKTQAGYIPYPQTDDTNFYTTLFQKKEFHNIEGQISVDEYNFDDEVGKRCSVNTFRLAPHQIFVKRFLSPQTPYNGLLLYHEVGVGKTCTAISIAEQYYGLYKKKTLVVLSSTLKENFKKQIFDIMRYDIDKHEANL